jgi:hypothetical protein
VSVDGPENGTVLNPDGAQGPRRGKVGGLLPLITSRTLSPTSWITLVRALRPPFRLAKLEADDAFVYAVADKIDGSLLPVSVQQPNFVFRKRLRNIKRP